MTTRCAICGSPMFAGNPHVPSHEGDPTDWTWNERRWAFDALYHCAWSWLLLVFNNTKIRPAGVTKRENQPT